MQQRVQVMLGHRELDKGCQSPEALCQVAVSRSLGPLIAFNNMLFLLSISLLIL